VGHFTGQITDLNIWNIPLSHSDVESYALKCNRSILEQRKVINWEKLKDYQKGNLTRIVNINRNDSCSMNTGKKEMKTQP